MDNVVPFKTKDKTIIEEEIIDKTKYWEEQVERREVERSKFKVIPINSMLFGEAGLVTFESLEEIDQYEKFNCGIQGCSDSWITCKQKFKNFPCQIFVRYIKNYEGYRAEYMTIKEYLEELDFLKGLAQIS